MGIKVWQMRPPISIYTRNRERPQFPEPQLQGNVRPSFCCQIYTQEGLAPYDVGGIIQLAEGQIYVQSEQARTVAVLCAAASASGGCCLAVLGWYVLGRRDN